MADIEQDKARHFTDACVTRAAELAIEHGASVEMVVDRFVTYGCAQVVSTHGAEAAINMLLGAIASIGRGEMDHLAPPKDGPTPANLN